MIRIKNLIQVIINFVIKKAKTVNNKKKVIWTGSQIDLMEIVYMIYMTEKVFNEKGRHATINELAEAIFTLMNKKVPATPTKVVDNIKKRHDPKELSILYKVLKKLYHLF